MHTMAALIQVHAGPHLHNIQYTNLSCLQAHRMLANNPGEPAAATKRRTAAAWRRTAAAACSSGAALLLRILIDAVSGPPARAVAHHSEGGL